MMRFAFIFLLFGIVVSLQPIQAQPLSERLTKMVMTNWPDSFSVGEKKPYVKWSYEQGVVLKGIEGVWQQTQKPEYLAYIKKMMDFFVAEDGSIRTYKPDDYNIDNVLSGRILLFLYKQTKQEKYRKAAALLRKQLDTHPRTKEGGFWHKKIYPHQMWLDGLYMGEPFYAEWATMFKQKKAFDDIAQQFIIIEKHVRDSTTGLLYHGWDESKEQQWANKVTGNSPNFWARAMGWYGIALVDVLAQMPDNHPKRGVLLSILNRFTVAISKVQDAETGLWYDVLDKPNEKPNYLEASASCMFVYTIAKAVKAGWLPYANMSIAKKAYKGIQQKFIEIDAKGLTNLTGTVSVSGLGGKPYRDGSFAYYMSEKVVVNDLKGVGVCIGAALEMESLKDLAAENMLLLQQKIGGWPKHLHDKTFGYDKVYTDKEKKDIVASLSDEDATIDNEATNKEIRYLAWAFKETGNQRYLAAVEKGVRYLLAAQYNNGGWPQFYPDRSMYRGAITYNDNAMINTLNVLYDITQRQHHLEIITDTTLVKQAANAVQKGIDCILKTQLMSNGKLAGWCQQYDEKTLKPCNARKFELIGISGSETVGILSFLMQLSKPTPEIKKAINAGVAWLEEVKIKDFKVMEIPDKGYVKGKDRVVVAEKGANIWARYYDIDTNTPFFCGRDGIKRYKLTEIEQERRVGYAWYGTWPVQLLSKKYPAWKQGNL